VCHGPPYGPASSCLRERLRSRRSSSRGQSSGRRPTRQSSSPRWQSCTARARAASRPQSRHGTPRHWGRSLSPRLLGCPGSMSPRTQAPSRPPLSPSAHSMHACDLSAADPVGVRVLPLPGLRTSTSLAWADRSMAFHGLPGQSTCPIRAACPPALRPHSGTPWRSSARQPCRRDRGLRIDKTSKLSSHTDRPVTPACADSSPYR
jgi:hypothetical protein